MYYSDPDSRFVTYSFTGHEHLDDFDLINMNGRMYDPLLAMFLSPDNFVQSPGNTQNLNRYAYCLNNPLKYTDPDGEWFITLVFTLGGGYLNGVLANNLEFNPLNWDWRSASTWSAVAQGMIGGYQVGAKVDDIYQNWVLEKKNVYEFISTQQDGKYSYYDYNNIFNENYHGPRISDANNELLYYSQLPKVKLDENPVSGFVDWFEYIRKNEGKDPLTNSRIHVSNIVDYSSTPKESFWNRFWGKSSISGDGSFNGEHVAWRVIDRNYNNYKRYRYNYISVIKPVIQSGEGFRTSYHFWAQYNGNTIISLTTYKKSIYEAIYNIIFH